MDIDTTVETVYGAIQGAKRGYNPLHRGKKGLRPVLAFIAETREYLAGNFRRGETVSGQEVARFILSFKKLLPGCVRQVIIRADAEFYRRLFRPRSSKAIRPTSKSLCFHITYGAIWLGLPISRIRDRKFKTPFMSPD